MMLSMQRDGNAQGTLRHQMSATEVHAEPVLTPAEVAMMSRIGQETVMHKCVDCGFPVASGGTCTCRDCCEDCCDGED